MTRSGGILPRVFRLRSPAELQDRGRQRLSAWLERFSRSPDVREASDASFDAVLVPAVRGGAERLFRSFQGVPRQRVFFAFEAPARAAELVQTRYPEAASRIVARARRAVADQFDIFGHEGLSYGRPIDWHLDPLRDRRAPRMHWSRVPYLDVDRVGDHKVIWELNRHQHLVTLTQAYWLTGDLTFAATVVRHVTEWMDANPPKLGINWSSSLEVAFRAISWTWSLQLLRSVPVLTPMFVMRVMKYLHVHAQHIATHLSTYFSPNTHLTGEALGLLYLGTLFPEFRNASAWREVGWSILERELDRQILPDGVYFEQATWYQRYTADFYLHAIRLRQASGEVVPDEMLQRVDRIIDPLVHFTRPDGTTPLIGDDDGGQLVPLSITEPGDFRSTLALAGALLSRSDADAIAGSAAALLPWLVGNRDGWDDRSPTAAALPERSKLFREGGYFVTRSRWGSDADYLVIDCGPHGALSCGHSHADALSVDLAMSGVSLVVDMGTYSYAPPERDEFRTTSAHNTLTVDGRPSSTPGDPFNWKTVARSSIVDARSQERFAFFEGAHDGFRRLPDPVTHSRAVFVVYEDLFIIRDRLEAKGTHRVDGRYHLAAGIVASVAGDGEVQLSLPGGGNNPIANLCILGREISLRVESGRIAPNYGVIREAPVVLFSTTGAGNQEVLSFFIHCHGATGMTRIRETAADAGRLFAFQRGTTEELIGYGDNGVRSDTVASDARWLWVRLNPDRRHVAEFIMLDGSSLVVDERTVHASVGRRSHITGRLAEGGWKVDIGPTLQEP